MGLKILTGQDTTTGSDQSELVRVHTKMSTADRQITEEEEGMMYAVEM